MLHAHPKIAHELVAGEGEYTASLLALLDIDEARSAEAIATLRSLSLRTQSPLEFMAEIEKAFLVDEPRV